MLGKYIVLLDSVALVMVFTWEATHALGNADRMLTFYHTNVYATCLLVLGLPSPHRLIMEENSTHCFVR